MAQLNGPMSPAAVRDLGIYGGAQGIWVDKAERTGLLRSDGVAVGIRLTGRHYPDDLDASGVLYHYPQTNRPPSRDAAEIRAVKNAQELGLPIFVITEPDGRPSERVVRLGWVLDHDDTSEEFLIAFGDEAPKDYHPQHPGPEVPFVGTSREQRRKTATLSPSRDPRFKFRATKRYSGRCPLSGCQVPQMLQAAHVIRD